MKLEMFLIGALGVLALSACSAVDMVGDAKDFQDFEDTYNTATADGAAPSSDTAEYNGVIALYATEDSSNRVGDLLLGELSLSADFDANTITGMASDFNGASVEDYNGEDFSFTEAWSLLKAIKSYDGDLAFSGTADQLGVSGTLTGDGNQFIVGGTVDTEYYDDGNVIHGTDNTDGNLTLAGDNDANYGELEFWAEQ